MADIKLIIHIHLYLLQLFMIIFFDGSDDSFFSYGNMLRTPAFLQSLPQDLPKLQRWIIAAVSEISRDMLQWVWVEMNWQIDVCHVTKGGHIEHLQSIRKTARRVSLSICRLHVTFLFATEVYQFHEMCKGIMNDPVIWYCMCTVDINKCFVIFWHLLKYIMCIS
jgi:hypothetical protein